MPCESSGHSPPWMSGKLVALHKISRRAHLSTLHFVSSRQHQSFSFLIELGWLYYGTLCRALPFLLVSSRSALFTTSTMLNTACTTTLTFFGTSLMGESVERNVVCWEWSTDPAHDFQLPHTPLYCYSIGCMVTLHFAGFLIRPAWHMRCRLSTGTGHELQCASWLCESIQDKSSSWQRNHLWMK